MPATVRAPGADDIDVRTRSQKTILCIRVDATSYEEATSRILSWAEAGESRTVVLANVQTVMEAWDSPAFRDVVREADMVTPDGMPLAWGLRLLGARGQQRVYGPDLARHVLQAAARHGVKVGLYGGTPRTLPLVQRHLKERFMELEVAYAFAPPFRPLTAEEDRQVVEDLARSGTRILLLGIGCPKQERWAAGHRGQVAAVMLGVGAAFDFWAGTKPQAPTWMQQHGLEWLFRLSCEPRRLWRRYLLHNPRFVALFAGQLARGRPPRV